MRSATPLGKTEKDWNNNKIKALIESAKSRTIPHYEWRREDGYNEQYAKTLAHLTTGHFKSVRIKDKKDLVDDLGGKCRQPNVIQQTRQQHQTPTVSGLIPIGKLFQTKEGHMEGLEAELLHRGAPTEDIRKWKIAARKDKLKRLEGERLMKEEGLDFKTAIDKGKKHFKALSNYNFNID